MSEQPETLHDGDEQLGGDTVDEAVANAEEGSEVEGAHTPSGQEPPGGSRVERMADVDGIADPG